MRISDWSSDVCSSDLQCGKHFALRAIAPLTICLSTAIPTPACAAEVLPPGVAASLQQAAERDVDAFRAALRAAIAAAPDRKDATLRHALARSEEHTSELQSLMRISYAVFCLKKKKK